MPRRWPSPLNFRLEQQHPIVYCCCYLLWFDVVTTTMKVGRGRQGGVEGRREERKQRQPQPTTKQEAISSDNDRCGVAKNGSAAWCCINISRHDDVNNICGGALPWRARSVMSTGRYVNSGSNDLNQDRVTRNRPCRDGLTCAPIERNHCMNIHRLAIS